MYFFTDCMKNNFEKINEYLVPLSDAQPNYYPAAAVDYLKFYGLGFAGEGIEHTFGIFDWQGKRLAAHIYKPAEYKAVFFVLHGYFNHCGLLSRLFTHLLSHGFAVAAFDLPGHGISQGAKCEIDDFSQYGSALEQFIEAAGPLVKKPYHFIGHSTGASAAIDILLKGGGGEFERIVLAAPLVHCAAWEKSRLGSKINIPFVKSVPRVFRKNSSDRKFVNFVKNKDPLQSRFVTLNWVRAMHRWNGKLETADICSRKIEIIHGTVDKIVDMEYNIAFLRGKFPNAKVCMIEGANHELFNESDVLRRWAFGIIADE